jgi:hypothetical protein
MIEIVRADHLKFGDVITFGQASRRVVKTSRASDGTVTVQLADGATLEAPPSAPFRMDPGPPPAAAPRKRRSKRGAAS